MSDIPRSSDVLIVGTGHAGAQAAISLRQQGFAGSIVMVGRDIEPPYERPPLSKEYLAGEKAFERIYIRPPTYWAEKDIRLELGKTVIAVDAHSRSATVSSGEVLTYGTLIWAAGGEPRRFTSPGHDLAGVHSVRDKADVDRITAHMRRGCRRVVVIGGGYIGLEAAAVLRKLGCEVALVEALPRLLARVAGADLSQFYLDEHRNHGVDVRLEATVAQIAGEDGRVTGVRLTDGEGIACDMVIVGIGIAPSIEPLEAAGARCSNGVEVDEYCRTNLPGVFAIGDCAAHKNLFADGTSIRLESVQNANDMAAAVASAICGRPHPYRATPWFWSNQYDLKLQTIGLSAGHDAAVLRGAPADRSFSVIYLKAGRVIALDCVNAVKDYVQGRKLVETRVQIDPAALAEAARPLKDILERSSVQ